MMSQMNVFVLMEAFSETAYANKLDVPVDRNGMEQVAYVMMDTTSMEHIVCFVLVDKSGTQ